MYFAFIIQMQLRQKHIANNFCYMFLFFSCVCICACTHVESGSLSLLPRPGILKAFARLFFPPSGAKAVMYSSKPTGAADSRFDNNETHSENIQHTGTLPLAFVFCHYELFRLRNTVLCFHIPIIMLCKLLKMCVYAFISLQTFILVSDLYLASLCLCPSALQTSELGYRCRCFPHSA